jgi:hypothetical protein
MIPRISGGAYSRPGTFFEDKINTDPSGALEPSILPFVVSESEAYCIQLQDLGAVQIYRPTDNISRSTATTATGTHSYTGGAMLRQVQYVQSADVMWLVHANRKPKKLTRTGTGAFTIADFDNGLTGTTFRDAWPYRAQNTSAITMSISAAAVGVGRTLTASSAFFSTQHVGAVFKQNNAGTIGCCRVTAFVSSTQVTVEVMVAFGATAAVTTWWESSWSDYRGWPRTVSLFRQRLVYGGNASQPDTHWFSESGDFGQMSHDTLVDPEASNGPAGSQAFQFTLGSTRLNLIQWLSPGLTLVTGTQGDEWVIDKSFESTTTGFGGDNISARRQSSFGSKYMMAQRAGEEIFFVSQSKDEVRSLVFNQTEQSFTCEPLHVLADHFPAPEALVAGRREVITMAWDQSRKTLWCNGRAGDWFGMTRDRKLGITAWHSHQPGGYDSSQFEVNVVTGTYTDSFCSGGVVATAVVPNPSIGISDLWVVVKREINGAWYFTLERMIGGEFPYASAYSAGVGLGGDISGLGIYLVDCATYNVNDYPAAENYQFGNLSHLNGQTLDGTAFNSRGIVTVTAGAPVAGVATLNAPYPPNITGEVTVVILGLAFDAYIIPVRPDVGSQIGSAQGAVKRIHKANVRFYRTLSAKVGADEDNLETVIFREGSTPMGKSAELFTGDKEILVDSDYDKDGYLLILQDEPLPFSVISISAEGQTYD